MPVSLVSLRRLSLSTTCPRPEEMKPARAGDAPPSPARAPSGGREGRSGGPARGGAAERTGWTFQGGSLAMGVPASAATGMDLAQLDLSVICLG